MTRIKICGITNIEDAQAAEALGADAIGFIFAKSPRRVTIKQAAKIIKQTGPFIVKVGVFADAPRKDVLAAIKCGIDVLQFHGCENDKYCAYFAKYCKIIKVIRVRDKNSLKQTAEYPHADAFLFDTFSEKVLGGTGRHFDWSVLKGIKLKRPFIVGGGVNIQNLRKIITQFSPYALDVCSGVEKTPGRKDRKLMAGLVGKIKKYG